MNLRERNSKFEDGAVVLSRASTPIDGIGTIRTIGRRGTNRWHNSVMRFGSLFVCLFMAIGCAKAAEKYEMIATPLKGYVELRGEKAKQFLIGNTLGRGAGEFGIDFTYLIDDKTVMDGDKSEPTCTFSRWRLTERQDCGFQQPSDETASRCLPYRIFVKTAKNLHGLKTGSKIGIYAIAEPDAKTVATALMKPILKGNASNCPLFDQNSTAKPLELPPSDISIPAEEPQIAPDEATFPGQLLKRFLVGNSIVWPTSAENSCDSITYYRPDGRIFYFGCSGQTAAHPRHGAFADYVGTSHWKMVNGRFCTESPESEDKGIFRECDSFSLRSFQEDAVQKGGSVRRLHAFLVRGHGWYAQPTETVPGLVVIGNAAHFKLPN